MLVLLNPVIVTYILLMGAAITVYEQDTVPEIFAIAAQFGVVIKVLLF